nr:MAG: hypothetical protein [Microvirus sp.]
MPSRYRTLEPKSVCDSTSFQDSIFKLLGTASVYAIFMSGIWKKKVVVVYDEYKHSYILLVPKRSCYFSLDFFHDAISTKFQSGSLFPYHYFYVLNAF